MRTREILKDFRDKTRKVHAGSTKAKACVSRQMAQLKPQNFPCDEEVYHRGIRIRVSERVIRRRPFRLLAG